MKLTKKIVAGFAVAAGANTAFAAGTGVDLTPLTSVFTADQIIVSVVAVGAVLMTVYVAKKAISMVISMVRGG